MSDNLNTSESSGAGTTETSWFKDTCIRGLVVVIPIMLTALIVWKLYELFGVMASPLTSILVKFIPVPNFVLNIIVMVITTVVLLVIGGLMLTRIGRSTHKRFEAVMKIVGPVYTFIKEALQTLISAGGDTVYKAILVPVAGDGYRPGYLIGDKETITAVEGGTSDSYVTVYFGHAPNPASGNSCMYPLRNLVVTDVPPMAMARCNATLGSGFVELFTPAIQDHLRSRITKLPSIPLSSRKKSTVT